MILVYKLLPGPLKWILEETALQFQFENELDERRIVEGSAKCTRHCIQTVFDKAMAVRLFFCKICHVLFLSWNICLEKHQPRVIKPSSRGQKQLWIYWWLSQIPFSYSMRLFRKVCTFFRIRLRKSYAFFFKVNWRNFDTCKVGNFRASLPVLIRFSAIVFGAMRNKPKMENSFRQLSPRALN